jgi:hypothetical protein
LEDENVAACIWLSQNVGKCRDRYRAGMVEHILMMADKFKRSGEVARSMDGLDRHTRAVLGDMNVPLIQYLMNMLQHEDVDLVEMLKGAPVLGLLATSGRGVQRDTVELECADELWRRREQQNLEMATSIRASDFDDEVMKQTLDEVKLGRISKPVIYEPGWSRSCGILSSRFGVEQGASIRCIDNATASGVNPCSGASERIREHRLDTMFGMAQLLWMLNVTMLAVCKSDVSAAFRRIPVLASQRWACGIVFMFKERLYRAVQHAMPFGYVGAVYAWERFAHFLWMVVVVLLRVPAGKYVDDFFCIEQAHHIDQVLASVAAVFRAIMGEDSLSVRKLLSGNPLTVLGFDVMLGHGFARFSLNEEKRVRWLQQIQCFRSCKRMVRREAEEMAGRLSFASEYLFKRLGRAMLRPIFAQKKSRDGSIHAALDAALQWWETALAEQEAEDRWYDDGGGDTAELYCDASGMPGHLCAVLFIAGEAFYCHSEVPAAWREWFTARGDAQIMSLEVLAIMMGLETFLPILKGRTFRVWTDNEGAKGSITSGAARCSDHNLMVHRIWSLCYKHCLNPWYARVPTDENVSDGPTRSDHSVVQALGCLLVQAQVPIVE